VSSKVKTSDKGFSLGSLEENLKKLKPMLSRKFKVKRLGIFGSYVRGQTRRSSDVDVLVEFSGSIDLLDFVAMARSVAEQTGAKIDLVSIKALRPEFRGTILNEVIYI
jgi:predicted nucleotidyltransferase